LLRPRVERVHLGFGVEGVSLVVLRQRRLRHRQLTRDDGAGRKGDTAQSQSTGELVDTLVNRLGEDRVLRPKARDSHRPERVLALEQVIGSEDERPSPAREAPLEKVGPRPSVLFDEPQQVEAMAVVPDRPPTWLRWMGEELRVVTGIGPERIGSEWWTPAALSEARAQVRALRHRAGGAVKQHTFQDELTLAPGSRSEVFRDYYRVQDQGGRWLWVCRESQTGRWFVHGIWA
jgi:protein ImuB